MKFNKKLNGDNRGFTLIELIVTVVILALVTAPFLSSFVSAGKTNVQAKREQDATDLSEYIIEQFKASSIDMLNSTYTLGNKVDSFGKWNGYETTISSSNLPNGYSTNYSAKVTMTKSASVVNTDVTPVIENIQKETCAMFINDIVKKDIENPAAYSRKCSIDISYDGTSEKKYIVNLAVSYLDVSGTVIATYPKVTTVKYKDLSSVYLIYLPLSSSDKIEVNNNVKLSLMPIDGDGNHTKLNLYIVNQDVANPTVKYKVIASNINLKEIKEDGTYKNTTLESIISGSGSIDNTIIYTNITLAVGGSNKSTALVKMESVATLYDITVEVSYAGEKVATFTSSKSTVN